MLVGLAYKGDLDDHRGSPAIAVYQPLEDAGAVVSFYESWTPTVSVDGFNATSVELTDDALRNSDAVIITTDHSNVEYRRTDTGYPQRRHPRDREREDCP